MSENYDGRINKGKNIYIVERDLDILVQEKIREYLNDVLDKEEMLDKVSELTKIKIEALEDDKKLLAKNINIKENTEQSLYYKYATDMLDKDEYINKKNENRKKLRTMKEEINIIEQRISETKDNESSTKEWINNIFDASSMEKINRKMLSSIVEKIEVSSKDEINIIFKDFDLSGYLL